MFLNSLIVSVLLVSDCLCRSDWDHIITVNGANGSDIESCLQGEVPCATLNMALKGLNCSNSTVIYISPGNYTLEYGEINNITGMDQTAIIGSGELETVVNCDPAAGLYIVDCTNITIQSLTFIGCGYENGLEAPFNPHIRIQLLPAALCFSSCQDVSVSNVTVQYSNGSGLLFKDISRYVTVHNSVISSGYYRSQTSSDIDLAVGGIVFTGSYYYGRCDCYFSISNSNITFNNYYVNSSECAALQAVAAVVIICLPFRLSVDSCLITNNNRALFVYITSRCCFYEFHFYRTAISQNKNASIIKGLDTWCIANTRLLNAQIVDSFVIIVSDDSIPSITSHFSYVSALMLTVRYHYHIFVENSSLGNYSIVPDENYCIDTVKLVPGYCNYDNDIDIDPYCPCPPSYSVCSCPDLSNCFCYDNHDGTLCNQCKEGYSVSVNSPYLSCVPCNDPLTVLKGWGLLIILEFVPVTIMVALIAIFNVNLNQGSLKAYIFFCQIMTIPFPAVGYPFWFIGSYNFSSRIRDFALLPFSIWNLGFISFPSCNLYHDGNECSSLSICISPNTTPLGAITFWYIIGFYPFLLLALIYGFIAMYDKGYKYVVCIGRPLHRFLARFWRMFNIQPSFTHTVASVYTLCFTQLAATSLKILHATTYDDYNSISTLVFMYDSSQQYFHRYHGAVATLALLVLIIFIVIPTVYLLIYPFKWFQKCFNKIKFKKDFLISVTDILSGPYKDGTQGSWDYRYFAGIYFAILLLLMMQASSILYAYGIALILAAIQTVICGLHVIVLTIFRPYRRNIHTFSELIVFLILILFRCYIAGSIFYLSYQSECEDLYDMKHLWIACVSIMYCFMCLVSLHCFVWILKKCKHAVLYQLATPAPIQDEGVMLFNQEQDDQDDDVFADRLLNPESYNEHHVTETTLCDDEDSSKVVTKNYKTF